MAVNPILTPPNWKTLGPRWDKAALTEMSSALSTLETAAPNVTNCDCEPMNCCQSVDCQTCEAPVCQVQCSTPCQGNQSSVCQSQCVAVNQANQVGTNQAQCSAANQSLSNQRNCILA